MTIVLIDAASDALSVSWPAVEGAKRYRLEYRIGNGQFELLSDKLTQTQARKRNLSSANNDDDDDGGGFTFRVAGIIDEEEDSDKMDWISHSEPFYLISKEDESKRMATPTVAHAGTNQALQISWNSDADTEAFEIQMRENIGGCPWTTIAPSVQGTQVRKKNLTSSNGYHFRIKRVGDPVFSLASTAVVARGLSAGMKRWFSSLENGTLIRRNVTQPIQLADAIGGKEFVLLYASAHWCPPCRKFTPMLASWYQNMSSTVEVVFLSCDHDHAGFQSYLNASHPWLAVDYDDDAREQLLAAIRVQGIPRLVVLDASTGAIVVDNAVGQSLDVDQWRRIAAGKKK